MAVAASSRTLLKHFNPPDHQEFLYGGISAAAASQIFSLRRTIPSPAHFPSCRRHSVVAANRFSSRPSSTTKQISARAVKIVAVVGGGSISPLNGASWEEVMLHTAERLKWVDEDFQMFVFTYKSIKFTDGKLAELKKELTFCDILVAVAINDPISVDWFQINSQSIANVICFESAQALLNQNKLGGTFIRSAGQSIFRKLFDTTNITSGTQSIEEVVKTVSDSWARYNSDDIRFCLLVIINYYIKPVPELKNLRAKGLFTVNCMLKNCGAQILDCLLDPNCRKALQCLNKCGPTDQVCNYRCIASYESPSLEAFSLCVLQKHNCLCLDAEIPTKPEVSPLSVFRGEALSHEIAEDLFIGWLGRSEWSWRVVSGQNPAYDQFPCQYQLFYRGKAKGSFWYEPVFQVRTLDDGNLVWRRRRYRVRRARTPGTFHFSVLDNGVVSKEFWTIVDVCDDLSWGLFHYSGAAAAAGISYTGAVLVSPDGMLPKDAGGEKLIAAMDRCRIKNWELYSVDNCSCFHPPLGIPEGSRLHQSINVRDLIEFSGDPLFLEQYWRRNAASSAILISGWHRMGYHAYGNGSISSELERHIRLLHAAVGNAVTGGRFIVFGVGSTQLFNSIVHSLSPDAVLINSSSSPFSVVATAPFYDAYRKQTVFFDSREYQWEGVTANWVNLSTSSSSNFVEFVTSPNNPDGKLMKPVIKGSTVICDHAYYWPHYTAIPSPADEDIMTFTLSKVSGHAGSRFGWALVKNREVYQKMLQYLTLNIMLISTDTQLRTLQIIKMMLSKVGTQGDIFKFSYEAMSKRWSALNSVMSASSRFSLQKLSPQYCNYFHKIRDPSPAYAWVKCEREEDWDCQAVMREAGIISRSGTVFGAEARYTRLSLMKTKDDFDQLLIKMEALVSGEGLDSW